MSTKLVGLNLARCVKDYIEGLVAADDITCVVSATSATSPEAMRKTMNRFCRSVWRSDPVGAIDFVRTLQSRGLLIQVGGEDTTGHDGNRKHWAKVA